MAIADIAVNEGEIVKLIGQLSELTNTVSTLSANSVHKEDIKALQDSIKGAKETLIDSISALESRITNLEQKLQNALDDITSNESEIVSLVQQLSTLSTKVTSITELSVSKEEFSALQIAINNANNTVSNAISELQQKVDDLSNSLNQVISSSERNAQEITDLSSTLLDITEELKHLDSAYVDIQSFEQLKNTLLVADNTLDLAVKALTEELNRMKEELQEAISAKADAQTVSEKFSQIQATIDNANESSILGVGGLRSEFQAANETINQAIQSLNSELDKAKNALETAIATKADAETVNKKIEELNKAIENAIALADSANNDLSTKLSNSIATAKQQAIKASEQYAAQIKSELEQKLSDLSLLVDQNGSIQSTNMNELEEQIKKAQVLPTTIASVSIVANIALAIWLFLTKKKMIV